MTRLNEFRFRLTDGREAIFYAPTYDQALELALTYCRAHGLELEECDASDNTALKAVA